MGRRRMLVASLVTFVTCCNQGPAAQVAPAGNGSATLFEGARLIAGATGTAIEQSAFLVQDGKILRVARVGQIAAPAGVSRVDLAGKTVIPALVSAHIHVGLLDGTGFGPQIPRSSFLVPRSSFFVPQAVTSAAAN